LAVEDLEASTVSEAEASESMEAPSDRRRPEGSPEAAAGEGEDRRSRRNCRGRSGPATSRGSSRASSGRSSSRGSGSRERSGKFSREEWEGRQIEALKALLEHIGQSQGPGQSQPQSKSLGEVVCSLALNVVRQDNTPAFTREGILATVDRVGPRRSRMAKASPRVGSSSASTKVAVSKTADTRLGETLMQSGSAMPGAMPEITLGASDLQPALAQEEDVPVAEEEEIAHDEGAPPAWDENETDIEAHDKACFITEAPSLEMSVPEASAAQTETLAPELAAEEQLQTTMVAAPRARPPDAGFMPARDRGGPASLESVLEVLRLLETQSAIPFTDLLGQILWRHRRSGPLQNPPHRTVAENVSWAAGDLGPVEEVFRAFTLREKGRMRRSEWIQVVQFVQRNPVLRQRVRHCEADRLFYSACSRNRDENRTICLSEFLELLLMLVETSGVHPWMVFSAVGCHAERVMALARAGELE